MLSVLRKPLALSLGDTAWVRHQLPLEERTLLLEHGIELLVPVWGLSAGELPLGLIVLGPRRSEEPYNQEDLELLTTIAHAVGALLERSSGEEQGLAECERCGRCYDGATAVCAHDGQTLTKTRGTILINGRYRLESRLGRGGMGTVYVAMDTALERPVAVKVIRDDVASPLDLASRFRREARAAASFAHPHVVRVYDFGVERSGRPFLVMELLEGSTLRERLASGASMDRSEALQILRGVCSALAAAHARALVHRDLKPENIFLQRHASGIVPKVLDFGLAKARHGEQTPAGSTVLGTSAGMLVGTLEYMAPEQVAGDDVKSRVGRVGGQHHRLRNVDRPASVPAGRRIRLCGALRRRRDRRARRPFRAFAVARSVLPACALSQSLGSPGERRRFPGSDRAGARVTDAPRPRAFATTRWTMVNTAGRTTDDRAAAALGELCEIYWPPLYGYLRGRGYRAEEAQDLTQGFFARLLETHAIRSADPARGRFRAFLLTALKRYSINEYERGTAERRGGRHLHFQLDFSEAERAFAAEHRHEDTPDRLFDRKWAAIVLDRALERLRDEYAASGKADVATALLPYLTDRHRPAVLSSGGSGPRAQRGRGEGGRPPASAAIRSHPSCRGGRDRQ